MPDSPAQRPGTLPEARPQRQPGQQRVRISPGMKACIEFMAYEGIPLHAAAQRAGITRDAAVRAFHRPHVKAAYNQLVADIRNSAAQQAYLRMNHLSQTADSEAVRLEANKWVAGVGNIAPLKRVEGRFTHEASFKGFAFGDYEEDESVDVTPDPDCASGSRDA